MILLFLRLLLLLLLLLLKIVIVIIIINLIYFFLIIFKFLFHLFFTLIMHHKTLYTDVIFFIQRNSAELAHPTFFMYSQLLFHIILCVLVKYLLVFFALCLKLTNGTGSRGMQFTMVPYFIFCAYFFFFIVYLFSTNKALILTKFYYFKI